MVEVNNGLFFPLFKPEVPWNLSIMLVDPAITFLPVVIFTRRNPEPGDKNTNR
jgi:hypothetical protein